MGSAPHALVARIARLSGRARALEPNDTTARGIVRDAVLRAIPRIAETDARARVSMRLVAEALRPDRDRGPQQAALHEAARALLDAVARFLGARGTEGRLALLEEPERAVIAIMRGIPESSPSLKPRTSDLTGESDSRGAGPRPRPTAAPRAPEPGDWKLRDDVDRELLREFVQESREYLEHAEAALLVLERAPDDAHAAQVVMRAFHSIKGTAGFLKLAGIVALAHRAESLLATARDRDPACSGDTVPLALRALDMLGELVRATQAALGGAALAAPAGYAELLRALESAAGSPAGETAAGDGDATATAATPAPALATPDAFGDSATARVRLDRLDRLVDLVGELVVAQWMIAQDPAMGGTHTPLARKVSHAAKLVRELHDISMTMRMVPLRATCHRVARLARDLAQQSGKRVHCELHGEMTELDRGMVELVADPLLHMVRNALDHGIEPPAERAAQGKPETGLLRLAASQVGGQVIIELSDDGRGLHRDRIVARAVALGLVRPDETLTDAEAFDLIFAPGLSTAERVTEVSGRGVGMDVVHRNLQALRGRVDVRSAPGAGTTFTLRVPLTLAVTDGMLIRVGTERYLVPTTNIVRTFRPERSALFTVAGGGEVVRLREEVLPIVRLHRVLDVPEAIEDPTGALLMIVAAGEHRCALLVDGILGQQQVVAKPAGAGIGEVRGIAGAAILGDGCVGLILDVPQLMQLARHGSPGTAERARAVA